MQVTMHPFFFQNLISEFTDFVDEIGAKAITWITCLMVASGKDTTHPSGAFV